MQNIMLMETNTQQPIKTLNERASHCSSWLWNRQNESAATRHEVETQTDARSCIDVVHKLQSDALSKIEKKLHLKPTILLIYIDIFENKIRCLYIYLT